MLRLVDAKKTNKAFSAYYIPENGKEKGFIELDLNGTVIGQKLTSYDEVLPMYFAHARKAMRRYLKENIIPHGDDWLVMWY